MLQCSLINLLLPEFLYTFLSVKKRKKKKNSIAIVWGGSFQPMEDVESIHGNLASIHRVTKIWWYTLEGVTKSYFNQYMSKSLSMQRADYND